MATSVMNTKKWETRINITITDIKKIKAFINWHLSTYKKKGWKGFNL
jgi:phage-related protein